MLFAPVAGHTANNIAFLSLCDSQKGQNETLQKAKIILLMWTLEGRMEGQLHQDSQEDVRIDLFNGEFALSEESRVF